MLWCRGKCHSCRSRYTCTYSTLYSSFHLRHCSSQLSRIRSLLPNFGIRTPRCLALISAKGSFSFRRAVLPRLVIVSSELEIRPIMTWSVAPLMYLFYHQPWLLVRSQGELGRQRKIVRYFQLHTGRSQTRQRMLGFAHHPCGGPALAL